MRTFWRTEVSMKSFSCRFVSTQAYERAVDLARTIQFFDASNGLLELVGFEVLASSSVVEARFRCVFASPKRPGSVAESKYNIGHDIYSLGVCLLEIGLWESFLVYDEEHPKLSPLLSDSKAKWKRENDTVSQSMSDSQIEQKVFITLAGDSLAYEMGEAYSKLVLKCLTCVEKGFGNVLKFIDSASRDWDEQGDLFIQETRRELAEASTMGSGIYNRIS
jgi:hypothetical protein